VTQKQMFLGMAITDGYGTQPGAWRATDVDPGAYADIDATVRHAQSAERGKFAFLFTPDFPAVRGDVSRSTISNVLEPMLTLTAIARGTERIGLVATGSTTFQEPFNLARQFKALDVISHGRAGWNAVTTADAHVAANYGKPVAERSERYQRAHETVQIAQALWGSWERDAWIRDQESGTFIDPAKLQPINLQGQYVASRGPLAIPPSEQGQPVIFTAGGPSPHLLALAGRYASAFIAEVWTIEEARAQRAMVRDAAARAGRDPDEIKYVAGIMTTVAATVRDALDRRIALGADVIPHRVPHLGQMLGLHLDPGRLDEPLRPGELAAASASPNDPRSERALEVARQGWTIREILAHGVIDYHPTTIGPASVTADHLQAWFEAEAADGFWVSPDVYADGVDAFVDGVVPILQERGVYPTDYAGPTLRDHLGVPAQYGLDPRVTGE
jgi:FMN-dependent oxidoreductase (nitrilotriacetate monooxygenase family)